MGDKKAKKQRFFMKRVENPGVDVVLKEDANEKVFPQNSRSIPASIYAQILLFISYFGISFLCVVLGYNLVRPIVPSVQPLLLRLTYYPFSASTHLDYLSFLVSSHRLQEAAEESTFISHLQFVSALNSDERSRYAELNNTIAEKQGKFRTVVDRYLYWKRVAENDLNYRDALYNYAVYSYMLFDDATADRSVREAIALDPQFSLGKTVLKEIQ